MNLRYHSDDQIAEIRLRAPYLLRSKTFVQSMDSFAETIKPQYSLYCAAILRTEPFICHEELARRIAATSGLRDS